VAFYWRGAAEQFELKRSARPELPRALDILHFILAQTGLVHLQHEQLTCRSFRDIRLPMSRRLETLAAPHPREGATSNARSDLLPHSGQFARSSDSAIGLKSVNGPQALH
jgi:hypothetical protein